GAEFHVQLTRDGQSSPILRLDSDDSKHRERWRTMPSLQGVSAPGRPNPASTVLMPHPSLSWQSAPLPILTAQRYGAGRSMVLGTASSWRWQMLMPSEDQSHERLWRQVLRWLASESQQRISLELDRENYSPGDTVRVSARLLDEAFEPDNNGLLWLQIKDPAGNVRELPMEWQLEKEGSYSQQFQVGEGGVYDLSVKVPSEVESELSAQAPLMVSPSRREFLHAQADHGLMRRLAEISGGRHYTARDVHQLADDLAFSPNAYSKMEMHSLWDQPLFLILLVLL